MRGVAIICQARALRVLDQSSATRSILNTTMLRGPMPSAIGTPALPLIKRPARLGGRQIDPLDSEREDIICGAGNQCLADLTFAILRIDPDRRHPWRILRHLIQIRRDHRRGAEKNIAVMRHQCERNRIRVQILVQAPFDITQWYAARLPSLPPDAIGHRLEKGRPVAQVGDRKTHPRCFLKNAVARPHASSAAARSCTVARCSLTKAWSAS